MKILPFRTGHIIRLKSAITTSIIVAAFVLAFQLAPATEPTDQNAPRKTAKSTRITADKLVVVFDAAEIDFIGNVKTILDGAVITADRLKVIYDPDAANSNISPLKTDAIRKIIATGRVKVKYDDITARANRAVYTIGSGLIVLTGAPARMAREGQEITGSKFTIQRAEGTLKVEGRGEERVRAIIRP